MPLRVSECAPVDELGVVEYEARQAARTKLGAHRAVPPQNGRCAVGLLLLRLRRWLRRRLRLLRMLCAGAGAGAGAGAADLGEAAAPARAVTAGGLL